jgi:hypothetical protein
MADPRESKGGKRSSSAPSETRPEPTKLAHWPPPFRSGHSQPKIVRHQPGETPERAKARGWRLTRSQFSEFSDD